jgi:hypothetical protein
MIAGIPPVVHQLGLAPQDSTSSTCWASAFITLRIKSRRLNESGILWRIDMPAV